jgi:hypothetical protein
MKAWAGIGWPSERLSSPTLPAGMYHFAIPAGRVVALAQVNGCKKIVNWGWSGWGENLTARLFLVLYLYPSIVCTACCEAQGQLYFKQTRVFCIGVSGHRLLKLTKLFLGLTNYVLRHEDVWGSGCNFYLGASWEVSGQRHCFTSDEWAPGWVVGPRTGLDNAKTRKSFPYLDSNSDCNHSLYLVCWPESCQN